MTYSLDLATASPDNFAIQLANDQGEEVLVGYDKQHNQFYVDRTKSGKIDFESGFAKRLVAPRIAEDSNIKLTLVVDINSVELFADDGLTVLTGIFFPNEVFDKLRLKSSEKIGFKQFKLTLFKSK